MQRKEIPGAHRRRRPGGPDLAWRGVKTRLVERGDDVVRNPKTGHISMRGMEFFRRRGIAKRIGERSFASGHHGSALTEDDQWRKLDLVVETAREVWGTA